MQNKLDLFNFVLDEDKLEYLSKNKVYFNISSSEELYELCSEFIFDCNRNQMIQMISYEPELQIKESILYDILKLYIFDFERNIAFRHLSLYINPIQNTNAFENLYTYSNEKNIFLSIISESKTLEEPSTTHLQEEKIIPKKKEHSNSKKNRFSSCVHL
jgi:hypothetical protein